MGLFDRFKKKKDKEEKPKEAKKGTPRGKVERKKKKKKEEPRLFDPSKVPSGGKEAKKKPEQERKATKKQAGKEKTKKAKKEDTGEAYRILLRPLVTEKATNLGVVGQYLFEVAPTANKLEIKKAIHDLYGVEVVKVNVINQSGKKVQYGRSTGRTKNWKKAVITLKPGEKIEIYEGV